MVNNSTENQAQAMTTEQMLNEARKAVAHGVPATNEQIAANENAAPGAEQTHAAKHSVPTLTAQQHLQNAGTMYAQAGACFAALYQQEVLQQAAAQSR